MLIKKTILFSFFFGCVLFTGWLAAAPAVVRAGAPSAEQPQVLGPVQTLPPNDDGSITHVVKYGETLVDIAQAYGISLQELYDRNGSLSPTNPSYFEGDILIIRPAFTETPYVTQTYTPNPPTRTPLPTRTPRPTYTPTPLRSPTATRTPTSEP